MAGSGPRDFAIRAQRRRKPRARRAFGYPDPHPALRPALALMLKLHANVARYVPLTRYPSLIENLQTRSYGKASSVGVEALGAQTEVQRRVAAPN
jgi:hypothetical protein